MASPFRRATPTASNIAIHTPTPWPEYLNDTDIEFEARSAEDLMRKYYGRNAKAAAPPTTVINHRHARSTLKASGNMEHDGNERMA